LTKEKNHTVMGRRSGKDKTAIAGCPNGKMDGTPNPKGGRGERVGDGLSPVIGERQTLRSSKR